MATHGNNILVTASDGSIYASKSCDITRDCEVVEIASPSSGTAREYIAGRTDWSVSCTYLVGTGKIKTDLLKVGATVTLTISERGTQTSVSGSAIITQCHITATRGNLVQGSFSFKGNGTLE